MVPISSSTPISFDPNHPLARSGKKIIITLVLFFAALYLVFTQVADGRKLLRTFLEISPVVIMAMAFLYAAYLFLQSIFYRQVYRAIGHNRDTPYLVSLYLSMNLINTVAPVVGLSGAAYMIYLEKGNGLKKAESILINVLYHLIDYLVFLFILVASLIYLYVLGEITPTIVLTSLVFAGFVIAFGLSCLHLLGNPQNLAKTIRFFDRIAVRLSFSKKKAVDMRKVNNFSEKAQLVWKQSHLQPKLLGRAAASSFCIHAVSLGLLWLSFWAIGISANLQIVAAGYTVGTLLRIVSVTPGGIGFAEGGMTAVFTALGLPLEQSLIVTLLYRTVFTWLPLLLGVPAHHLLPQLARKWNVN